MSTATRWTLAEYDELIRLGAIGRRGRERRELIYGEIRDMSPIGPGHEYVVDLLNAWSHRNLPSEGVLVRVQNSIGLPALASAPEPDVAWVVDRNYSRRRPTSKDVLLVIEVADSSLAYDRGEKAEVYARAGVKDLWVVSLPDRLVEVHRRPRRGRYALVESFAPGQRVAPLALPKLALRVSDLFSESA
jgi:Uma2 family endonuclease